MAVSMQTEHVTFMKVQFITGQSIRQHHSRDVHLIAWILTASAQLSGISI